jgi:hypothetical protein
MKVFFKGLLIVLIFWSYTSCLVVQQDKIPLSEKAKINNSLTDILAVSNNFASLRIEIPPGGYQIVYYDKDTKQIKQMEQYAEVQGLPYKAVEAIIRTPQWIRKDLIRSFIELYKIPIEAGKGFQIAFSDVSGDGKEDLIIKSADGVIRSFITPYWKEETCKVNINKFQNTVLHDVTGDGLRDLVGISEKGTVYFRKNFGTNDKPYYLAYTTDCNKKFDITAGHLASPSFGDINGDKITDMVIGNKDGNLTVYYGPDWETNTTLPIKVNRCSKPVLYDINKDGKLDLVVGCTDGRIYTFIGSDWKEDVFIFKNIKVSGHSAPTFSDINNDGKIELCVGSSDGKLFVFEETQNGYTPMQSIFENIKCGDFISPCFYDINADGKDDLIIGNSNGELYSFLAPKWEVNTTILSSEPGDKFISPCFGDIDNDGMVELVIGNVSGQLIYFENAQSTWQESNSWDFVRYMGMDSIKNYYDRYYAEKEELLGMNDATTLLVYANLLNNVEKNM